MPSVDHQIQVLIFQTFNMQPSLSKIDITKGPQVWLADDFNLSHIQRVPIIGFLKSRSEKWIKFYSNFKPMVLFIIGKK